MYLFYVDESGTPDPIVDDSKKGCSKKFVIGGILIKTDSIQSLEENFYLTKEYFLKNPLQEMKYNTSGDNIKKGFNKENLRNGVYEFIKNCMCDFQIITVVINKEKLKQKSYIKQTKEGIYSIAFQFLLERLNLELNVLNDSCLVVLDSRNKNDNKTLYCSYMHLLKNGTIWQSADKFNHFLPSIAFSDSEFCMNLCVADFCCASVFQLEEYKHPKYYEYIKNKFRNNNGKIRGYGIAYFP